MLLSLHHVLLCQRYSQGKSCASLHSANFSKFSKYLQTNLFSFYRRIVSNIYFYNEMRSSSMVKSTATECYSSSQPLAVARMLTLVTYIVLHPNGHVFVDSPSIRRGNSTWKVRRNYIDFERRIHVEIMTSIRLGYFDVDSTFKINKISMSSMSFRRQIDVTSVLAVSILSFSNIFCSGNLF